MRKRQLSILTLMLFMAYSAGSYAATVKLYYNVDGTRGWKGGYATIAACHEGAKRNRYSATQYYCSTSQDMAMERRLGWR